MDNHFYLIVLTPYLIDDLGRLFEELLAGHVLRLELLYLRLGGLPRLARRAAPVAVVHAGRLDAEQLRAIGLRPRADHHRRAEGPHLQKKAMGQGISTNYQLVFPIRGYREYGRFAVTPVREQNNYHLPQSRGCMRACSQRCARRGT